MNRNHLINFLRSLALTTTLASCATYNPQTENASISEVETWDSVSISLSRSLCFGACPSYFVEIEGDGTVNYCGRNFVKEIGKREDSLPQTDVQTLFNRFKEADFEALDDKYKAPVTDLPTYTLRLAYDDTVKTVIDYGGEMIDMPAVVTKLQQAVDETATTKKWVGDFSQRRRTDNSAECDAAFEPHKSVP
ncbi:DUF6438 domain-containing protein [Litorimonas haliclonae]|uniref:DUF6438 domain-containing protein n=1 Tax=Litorimonas haliclonae TaxID=2081977 RepID=UPI0039EE9CAB